MIFVSVCVLVLPFVLSADPCSNYKLIKEVHRSADYYVQDKIYEHLICDRTLEHAWYRFDGNVTLTKTCVQTYHCGTHIPLWMNGNDPSVADDIVVRQICGTDPSDIDCCTHQENIRVKNCGGFIIYELVPAKACAFAYCAGTGVPCPSNQWSPTGFLPCKDKFPKMVNNPTLSNPIVKQNTFEFNCTINFDPNRTDVGFEVQWLFDSKDDPNVPITQVNGTTRVVTLDQKYLKGHLGETLTCKVLTFNSATPGVKGPFLQSQGYWCGIKLETTCLKDDPCHASVPCSIDTKLNCTTSLTVGEHETKPREVRMISTVPITCDPQTQPVCHTDVYLDNNDHTDALTKNCTYTFVPGDWNASTHQAVVPFQVSALRDGQKDGDKNLALHLNISKTAFDAPPIFWGYNLPYLPVHTIDKDTSQCACTGDPHCTTLDSHLSGKGVYYDYYKVGEFTMYESTASNRLFQVQARTWPCGTVTCNCGVAAREGNDVIIIDMCQGVHNGQSYPVVDIPNKAELSHGTVVYQDTEGHHFLIDFPSGAKVKVDIGGFYMNIYITAPEEDYGATQGLCGTFDGNTDNDLTHKSGVVDTFPSTVTHSWEPSSFVESWRIPVGQSLFDKKDNLPYEPKYNQDIYYCNCDQKKSIVDCNSKYINGKPAVQALCAGCKPVDTKPKAGRKRRAASNLKSDSDPPKYQFDYGLSYTSQLKGFPTANGKTEADARKACTDAFTQHATIQQCEAHVQIDYSGLIDVCIEDFKFFDDGSLIKSAVYAAVMTCVDVILKNVTLQDDQGNPPAFIATDRCPNDCSGNGACVNGTCQCNSGYVGDGCSVNAQKPPEIYAILTSNENSILCDVTSRPCETIFVAGSNFYLNSHLKCSLAELKFDGTGFVPTGRKFTTDVEYSNMYHVGCRLPSTVEVGGSVVGFNISVTNDGQHFSNPVKVVKTDSTCLNCRNSGESCQIKADSCFIDGACHRKDDMKRHSSNLKCDPSKSNFNWTLVNSVSDTTTLPPATLGGIAYKRFDIWTTSKTGCQCAAAASSHDCACCDDGGCQCPAPNQHQCTVCGSTANCGNPQPGPEMGIDGYTLALADCQCSFDASQYNCACCNDLMAACPCGRQHRNQCVDCKHMDQCGNKPWIYGPPIP